MTLWGELLPDLQELQELNEYGGGDHKTEDFVAELLEEIQEKLAGGKVNKEVREDLIDEVLPFCLRGTAATRL